MNVFESTVLEAVEAFHKLGEVVKRVPSCSHGKAHYCGAYLLKHMKTGRLYVGSHANLYSRPYQHSYLLRHQKHWNKELQAAYNDDPNLDQFIIVTNTREEGYQCEQAILDKYHGTGVLFNVAKDAKLAMTGLEVSDETRLKLSQAGKGRPHTEEHRMRISEANMGHRHSDATIAKMKERALARGVRPDLTRIAAEANSVKIEADGVIYPSKKAAGAAHGIAPNTVSKRIRSKNPDFASWKFA